MGVLTLLLTTLSYSCCTSGRMYSFQWRLLGWFPIPFALSTCSLSMSWMFSCTLRMVWGLHQLSLPFFCPIFIPYIPTYYYYYLKRHPPNLPLLGTYTRITTQYLSRERWE